MNDHTTPNDEARDFVRRLTGHTPAPPVPETDEPAPDLTDDEGPAFVRRLTHGHTPNRQWTIR